MPGNRHSKAQYVKKAIKTAVVKKIEKRVQKLEKAEKADDVCIDWDTIATAPVNIVTTVTYEYLFNTIPIAPTIATCQFGQGENQGNYEGQSLHMKLLEWDYKLTAGDTNNTVTIMLIWDREITNQAGTNYDVPNANDLLGPYNGQTASVGVANVFSKKNVTTCGSGGRFQVMYKKTHCLIAAANTEIVHVAKKFKLNKNMTFRVNSAGSGSSPMNGFFIVLIGDSTAVPHPTMVSQARLWFDR